MSSGLLDTSVFVARETGRPLAALPDRVAVSVMTLGELELGVRSATDETRARRAATLAMARAIEPLPVTEAVTSQWARLVQDCRRAGIHRTVRLVDALIAATAVVHGVPVVTQDDDFARIAAAHSDLRVLTV